MIKEDNAMRQKCINLSAYQAEQRAQLSAQAEQQRLQKTERQKGRRKRRSSEAPSLVVEGHKKICKCAVSDGLSRGRDLSTAEMQAVTEDIFRQLVG